MQLRKRKKHKDSIKEREIESEKKTYRQRRINRQTDGEE